MYFDIAKITDKGGRPFNQDYADFATEDGFACVAVADGLGAYEGSEIAGETAVKSVLRGFIKAVRKEEEIFSGAMMNKLFKHAHNAIHKRKNDFPEMRNGCTTLSVAITDGKNLVAAHAGDTRIYYFKSDALEFYSKDHSLARLAAERGEIEYSEIRTHKDQNKLTRVLGSDYFIQPDFKVYRECGAQDALIVCTDGFWEYVYERDMEKALHETSDAQSALKMFEGLIGSRAQKGNDNFSAIVLRFRKTEPEKQSAPAPDLDAENSLNKDGEERGNKTDGEKEDVSGDFSGAEDKNESGADSGSSDETASDETASAAMSSRYSSSDSSVENHTYSETGEIDKSL